MARFLLIGLDGAEPSLVDPWMDSGQLPNLARLRERGAYLPCASTTPPVTFPAWTTCVTGVNPGRHGIFDFTTQRPDSYGIQFVNSTFRKAPAIWRVLSDAGKRVCVLGVPATYPPEPVNGVMVSGFDSPVCTAVDVSFVHPRAAYARVRDWRFADFQESNIGPGWHDRAFERLLNGIATKERIATELLSDEAWDFFMIVFGESDTVSHHFWSFHDDHSPRHLPGRTDAIQKVYERLDEAVGALVDAAGEDVVVGIVSDHGFGGSGTGVVQMNNWLAEQGDLRRVPARGSVMKRAAMTMTPERWRGAVFRRFTALAAKAESGARIAGIDWTGTKAWSEELNYFPSVRINVAGRERQGQVLQRDYAVYVRDLCDRLEAWAPIAKAWPRAELFDGPWVDRAPDIVLELALENGYSHSFLRSRGTETFRRLAPSEFMGGKEKGMTGNHRPTGVFFLSEPVKAERTSLSDVAPTVYSVLGVAGPAMDGRSLLDAAAESDAVYAASDAAYTPEQEAVVEARLRELGYFE